MGNTSSGPKAPRDAKEKYKSFPGSTILEKTFCGSIDTTDPDEYDGNQLHRLLKRADMACVSSRDEGEALFPDETYNPVNPSSELLARALVSEVTDNPKTMKPAEMALREYKLLKAKEAAAHRLSNGEKRAIGAPGGVGPPNVLQSFAYACTGDDSIATNLCAAPSVDKHSVMKPGPLQENRAMNINLDPDMSDDGVLDTSPSPYTITIGLAMSRRSSLGHSESITRQTAYDFNELQDRQYKYVSSTDRYGWRAGGGEKGGPVPIDETMEEHHSQYLTGLHSPRKSPSPTPAEALKEASPDTTHIPIIQIDCPNQETVDHVINVLASGDIFIPHMSVQPEALSVNGISPPDLVVRFGCERNDDLPPEEWPNWSLEFIHNQLYEYFYNQGARWMKRPFSITLARKVRWKTVKHMNRYFAHSEQVIDSWREKGPQYLDPQLAYIEGGATPDEVRRPHGIYLLRNGVPTNYFAPNFEPPYTTKMTRSLLQNVLDKSWIQKRREWSNEPIPKLMTPTMLMAVACGCTDGNSGGFIASEATNRNTSQHNQIMHAFRSEEGRGQSEEKKVDELDQRAYAAAVEPDRYAKPETALTVDDATQSVATSAHGMSVAASGTTTVVHHNKPKMHKGQMFTDENSEVDWSPPARGSSSDPPGIQFQRSRTSPRPLDTSAALEREHQHQSELMTQVAQLTTNTIRHDTHGSLEKEKTSGKNAYFTSGSSPLRKMEYSESLAYSADGSSAFMTLDGSSLLGQQYANDGSYPRTLPVLEEPADPGHVSSTSSSFSEDEELSVQASSSSYQSEIVPSDEDLYAFGWAKAIDPKSGNYYYFTLDRSKTVWENPLSSL